MVNKKIAIILGSGVSLHSGLPNINTITDIVLSTSCVARDYDLNYYLHSVSVNCPHVVRIQKLLQYIKNVIEEYHEYANIRYGFNYEEMYYLLYQISASENKEYENPAIFPLVKEVQENFNDEISFFHGSLKRYIEEAQRYIHFIVYQLLQKSNGIIDQFEIINSLSDKVDEIDIFTLNHDILLETFLNSKNIEFNSGFEKSGEVSIFNPDYLKQPKSINLYKLHGSIDWFNFQDSNGIWNLYCVPLDYDMQIDKYSSLDERLFFTDGLPNFLAGTFNKMLNYLSGIYELIFDIFKTRILLADRLIISGYGFGDKGINTRISHFIKHPEKELIIIHPNKSQLIETARGSFHINILDNPKVTFIEKKFEECTIDDIL